MKCNLCLEREADKRNTHYLTDSIIRTSLNEDGSNKREKGYNFDFSTNTEGIAFNFQRNTSIERIEKELGRKINEKEIERAKERLFSVDNYFCSECEKRFTKIENDFIGRIIPIFKKVSQKNNISLEIEDVKLFRAFFYLQIWRTDICTNHLKITSYTKETLRRLIFNYEMIPDKDFKIFPLSITYLITNGNEKEYTQNNVGFTNDKDPYLIFMNSFIIQFFESQKSIKYFDFLNLNSIIDFHYFINFNEDFFTVKIFNDDDRKTFNLRCLVESKLKPLLKDARQIFFEQYSLKLNNLPTEKEWFEFCKFFVLSNVNLIKKYSKEQIVDLSKDFINKRG